MVPNPGKSGNRFTRIFNRENWSILVKNQYFSVFQSWDIFHKFLSKLANFGPILIVVAYFSVVAYFFLLIYVAYIDILLLCYSLEIYSKYTAFLTTITEFYL